LQFIGSGSANVQPVEIYYHPGPPATFDVLVKGPGRNSFSPPRRFADAKQLLQYLERMGVKIADTRRFLSPFQDQPRWERIDPEDRL
jgi:hypothetical protein